MSCDITTIGASVCQNFDITHSLTKHDLMANVLKNLIIKTWFGLENVWVNTSVDFPVNNGWIICVACIKINAKLITRACAAGVNDHRWLLLSQERNVDSLQCKHVKHVGHSLQNLTNSLIDCRCKPDINPLNTANLHWLSADPSSLMTKFTSPLWNSDCREVSLTNYAFVLTYLFN